MISTHNNNIKYKFELSISKFFLIIVLTILFSYSIYSLSVNWSWILFIRAFCLGLGLSVIFYKIIQSFLQKFNIKFNINIIEKLYQFLYNIYLLMDWYNKASLELDNKYIPDNLLRRKNIIYDNKLLRIIMILFIIGYIINNMFYLDYNLNFIWNMGFISTGIYISFILYLDIKYTIPHITEFSGSSQLFDADGPHGQRSPSMRRLLMTSGKYGGVFAKFCYFCIVGTLGANWGYGEIWPDKRTPLARGGDYYNNRMYGIPIPPIDK